jgi:lipid A 3-O-deacylase
VKLSLTTSIFWIAAASLCLAGELQVQSDEQGSFFLGIEENDLVVRTDRHYTQGIKFAFMHEDNYLPGVIGTLWSHIPELGFENRIGKFGYQVGQNIYTPADINTPELLPDDRPYAGWLYVGFILHRRGLTAQRWLTLESFEVQLGAIGPPSLAEQAQTWIHRIRGFDLPQGWANQLNAEPGIAIRYLRAVRLSPEGPNPRYFDFIPHAGFSLGNVETAARLGVTARIGINLPENFGIQTISSLSTTDGGRLLFANRPDWGFYLFAEVEGWAVGYTAFLDGNLFQSSPHVTRETFVAEWKCGIAVAFKWVELNFAFVERTREFTTQKEDNGYGSLSMKVPF